MEIKENIASLLSNISGFGSILGSWQVCHSVCLGIVAVLGVIGIGISGMPLEFLTYIAWPLWISAFLLYLFTVYMYFRKGCVSEKLLLFNSGILIAGVPFESLVILRFIIGGTMILVAAALFARSKWMLRAPKAQDAVVYLVLVMAFGLLAFSILGLTGMLKGSSSISLFTRGAGAPSAGLASKSQIGVAKARTIVSGEATPGNVEIELTPASKGGNLAFEFRSTTHTVNLNLDLRTAATLEYLGKSYSPVEAPMLDGHHVSGLLVFDLPKDIRGFVVKITGVPSLDERVFDWRE